MNLRSPRAGFPRMWFGVVDVLVTHEGLGEQGLREVKEEVNEAHHGNTHVGGAELGGDHEWIKICEGVCMSFDVSERS